MHRVPAYGYGAAGLCYVGMFKAYPTGN